MLKNYSRLLVNANKIVKNPSITSITYKGCQKFLHDDAIRKTCNILMNRIVKLEQQVKDLQIENEHLKNANFCLVRENENLKDCEQCSPSCRIN